MTAATATADAAAAQKAMSKLLADQAAMSAVSTDIATMNSTLGVLVADVPALQAALATSQAALVKAQAALTAETAADATETALEVTDEQTMVTLNATIAGLQAELVALQGGGTTTPPPPATGTPPGTLFAASFARPLPAQPVHPNSQAKVNNLIAGITSSTYSVGVDNTVPVFYVDSTKQPFVTVRADGSKPFTGISAPITPLAAIGRATSAAGIPNSDTPLVIIDVVTGDEWDFWRAVPDASSPGNWVSSEAGHISGIPTGDGRFDAGGGMSASRITYGAAAITQADILSGSIDHMIAFDTPTGYSPNVSPALASDLSGAPKGTDPTMYPQEGDIYTWKPGTAKPAGLSVFAGLVFDAIGKYGMVIVDQAGDGNFQAQDGNSWTEAGGVGTDPITVAFGGAQEYTVVAQWLMPYAASLQVLTPPKNWPAW